MKQKQTVAGEPVADPSSEQVLVWRLKPSTDSSNPGTYLQAREAHKTTWFSVLRMKLDGTFRRLRGLDGSLGLQLDDEGRILLYN